MPGWDSSKSGEDGVSEARFGCIGSRKFRESKAVKHKSKRPWSRHDKEDPGCVII